MSPQRSESTAGDQPFLLDAGRYDAAIFDMDGVVTQTADVHAAAWKRLFDDVLQRHAGFDDFEPFDTVTDYRRYVDGKARYDGVRDFLASRGIHPPEGSPDDPADRETVHGLGNRKDEFFLAELREHGATAFTSTIDLVEKLKQLGLRVAVISASRNAQEILESAGVADRFETRVDGVVAADLGLPGKPHQAVFLEATRRLAADPKRTIVIEDATAGVEAGRRGGFGLVIGVDRAGIADLLRQSGADVVVSDLAQVEVM